MFTVSRRVSFSVVIALLLGWAAMSLMIFRSSEYLLAAETDSNYRIIVPRGIKLNLQVDKKVYRAQEPVLISLRNDSRREIGLAVNAAGCPATWWVVQRLGPDGVEWQIVSLRKDGCVTKNFGLEKFPTHTLKTAEWNGLVQTTAIGEVYAGVSTGTYRILVPYLAGEQVVEADWELHQRQLPSTSFTIQ